MAEMTSQTDGAVPRFGTLVNWAGALTSLALIAGLGVWGTQMILRDVSGVPVVRAQEGNMRVEPDTPGGRPASHQGLAVNSVAADGTAAGPADQLVLAPAPVDIGESDPSGTIRPQSRAEAPDAALATAETLQPATLSEEPAEAEAEIAAVPEVAPTPEDTPEDAPSQEALAAFVESIVQDAAPLSGETADTPPAETAQAAPVAGLARSLRPQARPAIRAAVAQAAETPAPQPASLVTAPDTVPAGTRLVQLGAFESPQIAETEWDRLAQRFDGFFDDKSRVIQRAESGGRTFYRLRAMGFADLSDARRFCSALVAENAACIPVVTR